MLLAQVYLHHMLYTVQEVLDKIYFAILWDVLDGQDYLLLPIELQLFLVDQRVIVVKAEPWYWYKFKAVFGRNLKNEKIWGGKELFYLLQIWWLEVLVWLQEAQKD